MGSIIIRDPVFCDGLLQPHPNGMFGIYQLRYMGSAVTVVPAHGVEPTVTPEAVRDVLQDLQQTVPLGWLGQGLPFEVLVTGQQLLAGDDPTAGNALGYWRPGWIALSLRVRDLRDTLAHEIAHDIWFQLSPEQQARFWEIVRQQPGDRYDWWAVSPWERAAEYISAALWHTPIADDILLHNDPDPTPETLERIRHLVLPIIARYGEAHITVGEEPRIVLTIGSPVAFVDGRQVDLDVPPQIVDGRTLVPLRFVAEAFGRRVDWEPKPGPVRRVLIY